MHDGNIGTECIFGVKKSEFSSLILGEALKLLKHERTDTSS